MASLAIAALPVQKAAPILLAATSKSPTKAATTEVWEDDLLRLPLIDVCFLYQTWGARNQFGKGSAVDCRLPTKLAQCSRSTRRPPLMVRAGSRCRQVLDELVRPVSQAF